MTSKFGNKISIEITGGSHTECMEAVLRGFPKGVKIDEENIAAQMKRRSPGQDKSATPRQEKDEVEILSGVQNGVTNGEDIKIVIKSETQRSRDYDEFKVTPRPNHADYPALVKTGGECDLRGGGHFSGRLTAPLTALGAICREYLKTRGIYVGGHIFNIGECFDTAFDPVTVNKEQLEKLNGLYFATNNLDAANDMKTAIENARQDNDSIGGTVEIAVVGMPVGIGQHMFGGVENLISSVVFGVSAVKGVSFGAGFDFAYLLGSEANDAYYYRDDKVVTATNNCGGIVGGMTTGMPIIIKAALKPTPSIAKPQSTVNLNTKENVMLTIGGRHDPCIVPRALPAIEAAVAIAVTMLLAEDNAV